jgi:release factor glutamine methyltransferase
VSKSRTILAALEWGTAEIGRAGKPSARLDAEVLLAHLLGIARIKVYLDFERPMGDDEARAYMALVRRRTSGEPVAYITGKKEFYSREFTVTPDVLIPRPETECVVEAAVKIRTLDAARTRPGGAVAAFSGDRRAPGQAPTQNAASENGSECRRIHSAGASRGAGGEVRVATPGKEAVLPGSKTGGQPPNHQVDFEEFDVLDLGCGSGCIGISIAAEVPSANVTCVDVSAAALEIARRNAAALGVEARVELLEGDLFAPVAGRTFDLIVSNPPYIPTKMIDDLQIEIRKFEPRSALDGGPDGLDVIRRILAEAPAHLRDSGTLIVEIAEFQADAVCALAERASAYENVSIGRDPSGRERYFTATKTAAAHS